MSPLLNGVPGPLAARPTMVEEGPSRRIEAIEDVPLRPSEPESFAPPVPGAW